MIKKIRGDILQGDADAILHQVNCQGVMGSGVAKQIREKYPIVYELYKMWCDDLSLNPVIDGKHALLGNIQVIYCNEDENKCVVNLFSQDDYGYDGNRYTDYSALELCLKSVNKTFNGCKIAIPYLIGCCRGGGDWKIVSKMIEEILVDCDVTLYEYDGR